MKIEMILNILLLVLITADLVCTYKRLKVERRNYKINKELSIDIKKTTKLLEEKKEKMWDKIWEYHVIKLGGENENIRVIRRD